MLFLFLFNIKNQKRQTDALGYIFTRESRCSSKNNNFVTNLLLFRNNP